MDITLFKKSKTSQVLPRITEYSTSIKKDIDVVRTFGNLLPSGDLRSAVLENVKGYMRKLLQYLKPIM